MDEQKQLTNEKPAIFGGLCIVLVQYDLKTSWGFRIES